LIKEITAYYNKLPEFLHGFRILHISDLHANHPDKIHIDIWGKIEQLEFDIAVITGDIIHVNAANLQPHLHGIQAAAERVPAFFIEGNHDTSQLRQITEMLESAGVTTLLNETAVLQIGECENESIEIIGLRDLRYRASHPFTSLTAHLFSNEHDLFRLVLTHRPQDYNLFPRANPELWLAGHTHGGQIRVPFLPVLYVPQQGLFPKLAAGLYDFGGSKMHVSSGVGSSSFPFRVFNPPEITIVELMQK
jgi:hypothetical protein